MIHLKDDTEDFAVRLKCFLQVQQAYIYREFVRFFRQRSRLIGALGQPIIFWVLFGSGLHGTFKPPSGYSADLTYQEYFFPGILAMILMFTAIFSTISLIEDRKEGFLQGILVSPATRLSIVFGKILAGSLLAMTQIMLFISVVPIMYCCGLLHFQGELPSLMNLLVSLGFLSLLAIAMTALGYLIAWPMDSTQGFHAVMSVVLMPMWLLSGAFFPVPETGVLSIIMKLNPLTYGVAGIQHLLLPLATTADHPSFIMCWLITLFFALTCVCLDIHLTQQTGSRDAK